MEANQENFDGLLREYRDIWNNRALTAMDKNSEEILLGAIKSELLDENSHPRIRKNRFEKYFSAIRRVMNSSISMEAKLQIISLHTNLMDELSGERE